MKVLVITDNVFLYKTCFEYVQSRNNEDWHFDYYCSDSKSGSPLKGIIPEISLKCESDSFFKNYNLFLSLHCKQIFPKELVNSTRCVNVHPGFNPYNRGWFPQVFSILNKMPIGATIHEIDEELDHGAIIAQERVNINSWDTSYDIYNRVQQSEAKLLIENFESIVYGTYEKTQPEVEGNVNTSKNFNSLLNIKLDEEVTWHDAINLLRALSFNGYDNAFFIDEDGNKIYIEVKLKKDSN